MTYSLAIDDAVAAAQAEGNSVREVSTGWEKVREVVFMTGPASSVLLEQLRRDDRLRFWSTERTPHNPAENGFTDDSEKVSISFPRLVDA